MTASDADVREAFIHRLGDQEPAARRTAWACLTGEQVSKPRDHKALISPWQPKLMNEPWRRRPTLSCLASLRLPDAMARNAKPEVVCAAGANALVYGANSTKQSPFGARSPALDGGGGSVLDRIR